jgi:hypothetical protein
VQKAADDSLPAGPFARAETGASAVPEIVSPASFNPVLLHCGIGASCPGKSTKMRGLIPRSNLLLAVTTSKKID